jgi:hypothetical protein
VDPGYSLLFPCGYEPGSITVSSLEGKCLLFRKVPVGSVFKWLIFIFVLNFSSVVEPEPRAEELKLNCLMEPKPKLPICGFGSFYLNLIEKHHGR